MKTPSKREILVLTGHLFECVPTQEDLTPDKKVGTAKIFYERLKFWCTLLNGTEKL